MSFLKLLGEKLEAQQIYDGLKGKYETRFKVEGCDYAFIATSIAGDCSDNTTWMMEFENIVSHRIGVGDNNPKVIKAFGEAVDEWIKNHKPKCFYTYGSHIDSLKSIIETVKKKVKGYNLIDDTADVKNEDSGEVIEGNPIGKITWTKMVEQEYVSATERSDTKQDEFEKTYDDVTDIKTNKQYMSGVKKTDKLDKGDAAYDFKTESVNESAEKINQPDYKYYCIVNGKIITGWEYREDANDHKVELEEDGWTCKILQKLGLKKLGLDPENNADWGNPTKAVKESVSLTENKGVVKWKRVYKTLKDAKEKIEYKDTPNGKRPKGIGWEPEKIGELKESVNEDLKTDNKIDSYVEKFKDTMNGSSEKKAMEWLDGIKFISKSDKEEIKKKIKQFIGNKSESFAEFKARKLI